MFLEKFDSIIIIEAVQRTIQELRDDSCRDFFLDLLSLQALQYGVFVSTFQ